MKVPRSPPPKTRRTDVSHQPQAGMLDRRRTAGARDLAPACLYHLYTDYISWLKRDRYASRWAKISSARRKELTVRPFKRDGSHRLTRTGSMERVMALKLKISVATVALSAAVAFGGLSVATAQQTNTNKAPQTNAKAAPQSNAKAAPQSNANKAAPPADASKSAAQSKAAPQADTSTQATAQTDTGKAADASTTAEADSAAAARRAAADRRERPITANLNRQQLARATQVAQAPAVTPPPAPPPAVTPPPAPQPAPSPAPATPSP